MIDILNKDFITKLRSYPKISKKHKRYVYIFELNLLKPDLKLEMGKSAIEKLAYAKLYFNDIAAFSAVKHYDMFIHERYLVFIKVSKYYKRPVVNYDALLKEERRFASHLLKVIGNQGFLQNATDETIRKMGSRYEYHKEKIEHLSIFKTLEKVNVLLYLYAISRFGDVRLLQNAVESYREGLVEKHLEKFSEEWFDYIYDLSINLNRELVWALNNAKRVMLIMRDTLSIIYYTIYIIDYNFRIHYAFELTEHQPFEENDLEVTHNYIDSKQLKLSKKNKSEYDEIKVYLNGVLHETVYYYPKKEHKQTVIKRIKKNYGAYKKAIYFK